MPTIAGPRSVVGRWPQVVAIGGGTGLPVVLRGFVDVLNERACRHRPRAMSSAEHLTAIVTVTDDGGSSGRLRRELGILPPGDVRNCLAALAAQPSMMIDLLQHRFDGATGLSGHAVGNLLLAALTQMTGDFTTAVERLSDLLRLQGRVLPSTRENVALRAEFECGDVVEGETTIVAKHRRIKRLSLEREVRPLPEALRALINAEAIVVGPGSLYTSVLPNLLVGGIASTISGVNAVRIYVANLMTEPGETDGLTLEDHLRVIRQHVGADLFDYVLVNNRPMDPDAIRRYAAQGASPLGRDTAEPTVGGAEVVERSLAWQLHGCKIRHAPADLADAILDLLRRGRPHHQRVWESRGRETDTQFTRTGGSAASIHRTT